MHEDIHFGQVLLIFKVPVIRHRADLLEFVCDLSHLGPEYALTETVYEQVNVASLVGRFTIGPCCDVVNDMYPIGKYVPAAPPATTTFSIGRSLDTMGNSAANRSEYLACVTTVGVGQCRGANVGT